MKRWPLDMKALLDAVVSENRDRVYVFDVTGCCRYASPAGNSERQLPGAEMEGRHWMDLGLSPRSQQAFENGFRRVLEGESAVGAVVERRVGKRYLPYRLGLMACYGPENFVVARVSGLWDTRLGARDGDCVRTSPTCALETRSDAMFVIGDDGRIASLNRQAERLFGYERDALLGQAPEMLIAEAARDEFGARLQACQSARPRADEPYPAEFMGLTRDGAEFSVWFTFSPAASGDWRVVCSIHRGVDDRASDALADGGRSEGRMWDMLADTVPAAVFVIALDDGRIVHSRARTWSLLGYDPQELEGASLDLFVRGGGDYAMLLEILRVSGGFSDMEVRLRGRAGAALWALASGKAFDLHGRPFACLTFSDITEVKRLRETSQRDPVTGLPNRTLLQRAFQRAAARADRQGESVGLLFIDIDDFKGINDTFGHRAGDLVLQSLARRIDSCIRQSDMVARWAGDEFVVFLEAVRNMSEVIEAAQKLLAVTAAPHDIGSARPVYAGLSIGVALYPLHGRDVSTLIERADAAMYAAKRAGKNRYRIA